MYCRGLQARPLLLLLYKSTGSCRAGRYSGLPATVLYCTVQYCNELYWTVLTICLTVTIFLIINIYIHTYIVCECDAPEWYTVSSLLCAALLRYTPGGHHTMPAYEAGFQRST